MPAFAGHTTGQADFPHPALGQDFTPSPTTRRAQAGLGVRAQRIQFARSARYPRPPRGGTGGTTACVLWIAFAPSCSGSLRPCELPYQVFRFADEQHAETFVKAFGGERMHPSEKRNGQTLVSKRHKKLFFCEHRFERYKTTTTHSAPDFPIVKYITNKN